MAERRRLGITAAVPLPRPIANAMRVHSENAQAAAVREAWRAAAKDDRGFVYFMLRSGGRRRVKIGWAKNPELRRKRLQTGSPDLLIVLAAFPGSVLDEKALHRRFEVLRCSATSEWFEMKPPLSEYIRSLRQA